MACLQSLPAEILSLIINEIPSIRDLTALSAQCRHLHTITDISTRQRFYEISLTRPRDIFHNLDLFLEILKNKRLASYVRKLKLFSTTCGSVSMGTRLWNGDDYRSIKEAAKVVGFLNGEEIEQIIELVVYRSHCSADSLGVMFMATCPDIEFLEPLTHDIMILPEVPLETFLQGANNNMSRNLRNLREVRLLPNTYSLAHDPRFYNDYDLLGALTFFHRLPSIELVSMDGVRLHEQHGIKRLAPRRSNITKIRLGHCSLHTDELCQMIDHCKVLEEFKFSTGGRASIDGTAPIHQEVMGHSISRHASTLRVLDLDIHVNHSGYQSPVDDEPFEFDEPGYTESHSSDDFELRDFPFEEYVSFKKVPRPPQPESGFAIGSLRDFTALTHLGIDIGFFTKHDGNGDEEPLGIADRLPPNLEYLCLRGYKQGEDDYHTRCVSELLELMAAGRIPRLKETHGISEYIRIAEDVRYPDENPELLWKDPNDPSDSEHSENEE